MDFFSEINSLLKDEKVFKSFINTSSEIGDMLINILQDDTEVIRHSRKYITEGYWEWIFPSLCMAYINYLDEDNSLDTEAYFCQTAWKNGQGIRENSVENCPP